MNDEVVEGLIIFLAGLVIKIHGLSHLHGLVITSEHEYFFWVF